MSFAGPRVRARLSANPGGSVTITGLGDTRIWGENDPAAKPECDAYKPLPPEAEFKENAIAGARIFPADVVGKPGGTEKFTLSVTNG